MEFSFTLFEPHKNRNIKTDEPVVEIYNGPHCQDTDLKFVRWISE